MFYIWLSAQQGTEPEVGLCGTGVTQIITLISTQFHF